MTRINPCLEKKRAYMFKKFLTVSIVLYRTTQNQNVYGILQRTLSDPLIFFQSGKCNTLVLFGGSKPLLPIFSRFTVDEIRSAPKDQMVYFTENHSQPPSHLPLSPFLLLVPVRFIKENLN